VTRPSLLDLLGGWQPAAPVLAAVAWAALYGWAARQAGPRWPAWRTGCFLGGLLAAAWALGSGLDAWAERLLSVHMVQHLVLALVSAPLLVAGAPERLALRTLRGPARQRLGRVLFGRPARAVLHPFTTAAAFAAVMLAMHLTGWYAAALRDPLLHALEHLAILATAIALFASLARAAAITGLAALTAATIPMGVVGAWLAWAPELRYPAYAGRGALHDQGLAAGIMWVGASLPLALGAVALAGVALWREERRQRRREALVR
jgi:putative membrane protein